MLTLLKFTPLQDPKYHMYRQNKSHVISNLALKCIRQTKQTRQEFGANMRIMIG